MDLLNWALVVFHTLLGFASAGHALLYKRDPRAAIGWIAVCLMFPLVGPLLYFLFGINRVRTRARELDQRSRFRLQVGYEHAENEPTVTAPELPLPPHLAELVRVSNAVTRIPLARGNLIELLHSGEQTYPVMLEAIHKARYRLLLTTYIFETNSTGWQFIEALKQAVGRGVDVKIMIDGIGEWYSHPRAGAMLRKNGLDVARFLPPQLFPPSLHINLRNHRKILVADGNIGFTGGINIGDRHLAKRLDNPNRVVDMHFRLTGPVVSQIEQVFIADWHFVTGEKLIPSPTPEPHPDGILCRTIVDGPNEDLDKLDMILVGAVALARRHIWIMMPYFLPSRELTAALQAAALRGVEVNIILPAQNNLPFVHWATRNMLWQLLRWGVRVYYQPPPFAHTKLFLVDNHYAQIGSANIDPRSLRLNFELNIEVFDRVFSSRLINHFRAIRDQSHEILIQELYERPLITRTRDALAWLFSPYL